MKKSRFSEEQITFALRQVEAGTPVADVCRQMGISEATFYVWKKKYGNLGVTELRQMRQLQDENARLKRLVADLTLDRHILQEVLRKRPEAGTTTRDCAVDPRAVPHAARSVRVGWRYCADRRSTTVRRHEIKRRCACASASSPTAGHGSATSASTSYCAAKAGGSAETACIDSTASRGRECGRTGETAQTHQPAPRPGPGSHDCE